jgi:hypothetical protein
LLANTQSVTAFYADTVAGSPIITAAVTGGSPTSDTQSETITAGTGTQLAITSAPLLFTHTAGPSATNAFTVTLEDAFGNPTTKGSAITVNLTSTSSGKKFAAISNGSSVTSVTLLANTTSVTAFYGDSRSGSPIITVAVTGGSPTSGTQTESVT